MRVSIAWTASWSFFSYDCANVTLACSTAWFGYEFVDVWEVPSVVVVAVVLGFVGSGGNAVVVAEYSIFTGGRFHGLLLKVLIVLGSKLLDSETSESTSLKTVEYLFDEVVFFEA